MAQSISHTARYFRCLRNAGEAWNTLPGPPTLRGELGKAVRRRRTAIEHDHPISLVKDASEMATLQARRSSVASRRDKKMVVTYQLYHTVTPASPGSHGTAAKVPHKILVPWGALPG